MTTARQLSNDIVARHQLFGDLALESTLSYEAENFTAALACLFVLIESALKYRIEADDEDKKELFRTINEAKDRNLITESQAEQFQILRSVRNKLFHENSYSNVVEIDEVAYYLSDPDTKKILYEMFWESVFLLTKEAVTQ